jgi:hypothetical protein
VRQSRKTLVSACPSLLTRKRRAHRRGRRISSFSHRGPKAPVPVSATAHPSEPPESAANTGATMRSVDWVGRPSVACVSSPPPPLPPPHGRPSSAEAPLTHR